MKKTRNILFTTLIMLLAMSTGLMAYSGGSGTSGDPYQISTTADLIELSTTSGDWSSKYFIQTANIAFDATEANVDWDGDGTANWDTEDQKGFSPIGNTSPYFTGSYDGDGHTIDYLYINRPATDYIGLFGRAEGATISDLGVMNVDITGDDSVGGLVGYNKSSSIVSNSYSTGSVSGSGNGVGGLVGQNWYSAEVSNSYSTGSVSGDGKDVGGLVGKNYSATVSNSYSTGSVTRSSGSNTSFGGFCGYNKSTIEYCYSIGDVFSSSGVAWNEGGNSDKGFVGNNVAGSTYTNNFWDSDASNQSTATGATSKTTAQMKTLSTFSGWNIIGSYNTDYTWNMESGVNSGYPYLSWAKAVDSSLPVELTSFTADNTRAGEITLNWVTESEIENLGFILERGAESEDGTTAEWTEIASYITDEALRGQGSVTYRTVYTYTDKSVEPGVTYDYRLADVSYAGEKVYHALNVLGVAVTEIPEEFALFPAYPNPFNPETVIRYQLSADSDVSLKIYDVKGQMIETLLNKTQDPGFYKVNWKPNNLPSGVYFCKLVQGSHVSTQKLILLK